MGTIVNRFALRKSLSVITENCGKSEAHSAKRRMHLQDAYRSEKSHPEDQHAERCGNQAPGAPLPQHEGLDGNQVHRKQECRRRHSERDMRGKRRHYLRPENRSRMEDRNKGIVEHAERFDRDAEDLRIRAVRDKLAARPQRAHERLTDALRAPDVAREREAGDADERKQDVANKGCHRLEADRVDLGREDEIVLSEAGNGMRREFEDDRIIVYRNIRMVALLLGKIGDHVHEIHGLVEILEYDLFGDASAVFGQGPAFEFVHEPYGGSFGERFSARAFFARDTALVREFF